MDKRFTASGPHLVPGGIRMLIYPLKRGFQAPNQGLFLCLFICFQIVVLVKLGPAQYDGTNFELLYFAFKQLPWSDPELRNSHSGETLHALNHFINSILSTTSHLSLGKTI